MRLRTVLVLGVLVVLAVGVVTGGTAAAKNGPPLISLEGGSFTQRTSIVGSEVLGENDFSVDARKARDGSMKGTFAFQEYGCLTNGSFDGTCSGPDKTLYEVAHEEAKVACLAADATTRTVWFSGPLVAVDEQRPTQAELLQQEQSILAQGNLIVIGRFQDTNGDGIADVRSLFLTAATTSYPNALTTDGDIGSPWFISAAGYSTAANACLQRDNAFRSADYQVVDVPTNTIQWLDTFLPVGDPITGTAANMANPPAASVYSLASFTRTLLSPNLKLAIRN